MEKGSLAVVNEHERSDKPECFAWLSQEVCNALVTKNCSRCSFYKARKDVNKYQKYIDIALVKRTKSKNNSN